MRLATTDNRPTGQRVMWIEKEYEVVLHKAGTVIGHTPEGYLVERDDDGTTEHIKHKEVL